MTPCRLRPFVLLCLALLAPDPGVAGAWTKARGEGIAILGIGREGTPIGMVTGAAAEGDKHSGQIYVEYGLTDTLTLGAKLFADRRHDREEARSAQAAAFARVRLWKDEASVVSMQAGLVLPVEALLGDRYGGKQPGSMAEATLSALAGRSWWGDWGSVFLSSAWGVALRGEGAADQIRTETTLGYKPSACCMAMVSLYGQQDAPTRLATPALIVAERSLKVSPSVAIRLPGGPGESRAERAFLQFSLTRDVFAPEQGLGIGLAVWRSF